MVVKPAIADDGLDDLIWQSLQQIIFASWRGDKEGFAASSLQLGNVVANEHDGRPAEYTYYLLGRRIFDTYDRVPTEREFEELADQILPKLSAVLIFDRKQLLDLLQYFFGKARTPLTGYRFILISCGVLGVLLNNPAVDLALLRPDLAKWHREIVKGSRLEK